MPRIEKECLSCNKKIIAGGSGVRQSKKLCSRSCTGVWNKNVGNCRGEKNGRWKGRGWDEDGYLRINDGPGRDEFDHRKIMGKHMGRRLESHEIVHHKDGDKRNNDIKNLEIMTRAEHMNHHRKEIMEGWIDAGSPSPLNRR